MKELILVLGGVRSGKSRFAEELAHQLGQKVLFVATAQSLDEDMCRRIERHRQDRPGAWRTLEAPRQVGQALQTHLAGADMVLLDCLTVLVSNLMMGANMDESQMEALAPDDLEQRVNEELEGLLGALKDTEASLIIVSNEVGMGVVPPYPAGRVYRDVLGRANQALAQKADRVYLLLAGIPVELKTSQTTLKVKQ